MFDRRWITPLLMLLAVTHPARAQSTARRTRRPTAAGPDRSYRGDAPLLGRLHAIGEPSPHPETEGDPQVLPLTFVDVQEPRPGPPPARDYTPEGSMVTVHVVFHGTMRGSDLRGVERFGRRLRRGGWYAIHLGHPFEGILPAFVEPSPVRGRPVCVSAREHAARFLEPENADAGFRRLELDLDRDGERDEVALGVESLCGVRETNCEYHVYRIVDGCARYLGALDGGPGAARNAPRHRGLVDLSAVWCGAGCRSWTETRYRFDGRRYRAVGSRECRETAAGTRCERW